MVFKRKRIYPFRIFTLTLQIINFVKNWALA